MFHLDELLGPSSKGGAVGITNTGEETNANRLTYQDYKARNRETKCELTLSYVDLT